MSCDAGGGWLTHACEGSHKRCGLCGKSVCFYHGHSNNDGVKGGHDGCRGACSTSGVFRINCEGHMKQCSICSDWYCNYHAIGVAAGTLTGGHVCDVRPRDPVQMVTESAIALAEISSLVYYVEDAFNPENRRYFEHVKNTSIRTEGIVHMAVFENGSKKVLAFKGTSLNANDLAQDIRMVLGGSQSESATLDTMNVAKSLIGLYGVNLITGHSLGGYYAEIAATNNHICGISFCNPGVNGPNVKLGGVATRGFQNINFEHDPLGNVYSGVYQHVQWSVYCNGTGHGIGGMIEYFSQRPTITNMNVVSRCTSRPTGFYNPN